MAASDVARALELMEDDAVAARMASGDLSDLPGEVSPAERDMIVAAAGDRPAEVTGYDLLGFRAGGLGPTTNVTRTPWAIAVDHVAKHQPAGPQPPPPPRP